MSNSARSIVQTLRDAGHTAYYAGGWVRDKLLGHPSADIDIATSATPEEVMALFEKTVPVGLEFGSLLVVLDSESFEVTTFRKEGPYVDGRHPSSIELSNAEEDAKRRSITINGMFYDPLTDTIHDFVGGQADLEAKIIRAIGNPDERFEEDRLRMIRAVRFATRLGFEIEEKTAQAIKRHAHTLFPAVAIERVWQEFNKTDKLKAFLIELYHFGLLQEIFPQLGETQSIEERLSLYSEESPTIAFLMQLFPGAPLKEQLLICGYLKVSKKEKRLIEFLDKTKTLLQTENDPFTWAHFYADERAETCLKILKSNQKPPENLLPHIERIRTKTPLVTADHLKKLGIKPGPQMGALLKKAEQIAINHNLDTPKKVLDRL